MSPEDSEVLDDLLSRWHHWRQGYDPSRGFNSSSAGAGQYLTSRQYDDQNGALDDALEAQTMQKVEFQIEQMHWLHQAALQCQARALTLGYMVFMHPRLPADKDARDDVIRQARERAVARLRGAGVM